MIARVVLENFQAHERLELELDPHVTVIVGPTDSGKSSVLRGVRWAATNRPAGDAFIRRGVSACRVLVQVVDGSIERVRGNGINEYRKGPEVYRAFGAGVPDAVAALANLDDLNFQGQMDGPLWFTKTAGEVSRELNQIVNLGDIDRVLSAVAAEARRAKAAAEVGRGRLAKARGERDGLAWVPKMAADLEALELYKSDLALKSSRIASIKRSLETLSQLRERLDRLSEAKRAAGTAVSRADACLERLEGTRERLAGLREALAAVGKGREELCRLTTRLQEARKRLAELSGGKCPLCGAPITSAPS